MLESKQCPRCRVVKPRDGFHRNRVRKDGLQVHCRDCYKEHSQRFYAENKAAVLDRSRRNYSRTKDLRNTQGRQWYAANKERHKALRQRWQGENRERVRVATRRYFASKPGLAAAQTAAYRATKKQATPPWANLDAIASIYRAASIAGLDVDHIVPMQSKLVCGLHVENNLSPLDPSANKSKGNRRWPDMWEL